MPGAHTSLLPTSDGHLEYLVTGSGDPVTLFGHGLASSIATTRPFGSGVAGTRAYLHFRGHGASSSPETPWTYRSLAHEFGAVAGHVGATQALGVSMGAGAICNLLESDPSRFDKVVLVLPAVIDRPREDEAFDRLIAMSRMMQDRDLDSLTELLLLEQPAEHREDPGVRLWCAEQARMMVTTDVSRALRTIPFQVPVSDRDALRRVRAEVQIIAQEADPAHPVWVARELAVLFPDADLHLLPPGGILWSHRAHVRRLIADFLS